MTSTNGAAPTDVAERSMQPDHFGRYVRRTFRRKLQGYDVAEVDAHLKQIRGWFSLGGFDRLLEQRREELLGSAVHEAEATVAQARQEADAVTEQARREAAATLQEAQRDAEAILGEATRRAEAATQAADERLAALKTLAASIIEDVERQS